MNKVYLLLSVIIFGLIIMMTVDTNDVQSYIAGNQMLKVYSTTEGTILKREYYVNGIISRVLEYHDNMISIERIYNEQGEKVTVNHYQDNQLIKSTNYRKGFIPVKVNSQEIELVT